MSLVSAYVEQEDNFIEYMTVKETFMFHVWKCLFYRMLIRMIIIDQTNGHIVIQARLRMDKRIRADARMAKVKAIIHKLGLERCENNIVGNPKFGLKGISGD